LSTAELARPAPAPARIPARRRTRLVGRLGRLRETTPGRLQIILTVLLVLGLLAGAVAGLTASAARAGTDDLGQRAQPLLL
jgi:hypothetical protein